MNFIRAYCPFCNETTKMKSGAAMCEPCRAKGHRIEELAKMTPHQ